MIVPHFSSTSPLPLREVVLQFLAPIESLSSNHEIDLHIMVFSFTDAEIAERLIQIATNNENVKVKILADWGLISDDKDRKLKYLATRSLSNLEVRFMYDQPYVWDAGNQRPKWHYQTSLGLLHHRTLAIFADGIPLRMLSGSYNMTKQAELNYENLIELRPGSEGINRIMEEIEMEFQTLWTHPELSVTYEEAIALKNETASRFEANPDLDPTETIRPPITNGDFVPVTNSYNWDRMVSTNDLVAFGSRAFPGNERGKGFTEVLGYRQFMMTAASGKYKKVPVDLSTVLLDLLFRCKPGSVLRVAIFALSPRVPEYGLLLEAARKGIAVRVILGVPGETLEKLEEAATGENLPLEVRYEGRCLHQKYVVDLDAGNVLTGTANMTTDAYERHAEHRFLFRGNKGLAQKFAADFDTIWKEMEGI